MRQTIPAWQVVLSDLSGGMVAEAGARLGNSGRAWHFAVADAQALPLPSQSVDTVVANHMLYHVGDLGATLAGIHRVLRPGGRLFAATVGEGHLKELKESLARFDPDLAHWGGIPYDRFQLDNAEPLVHHRARPERLGAASVEGRGRRRPGRS